MDARPSRAPGALADRAFALVSWTAAAIVIGVVLWITLDVAGRGLARLDWRFLWTAPADAGRSGGIAPILVSTSLLLATCLAASVPVALGAAMVLADAERRDRPWAHWTRASLDVLAGVPSIAFGLFGNAVFTVLLGAGFSVLSGGLTLACMILPLLVRTVEEGLRALPRSYRLGAAALGLSSRTTMTRILLPAALPSLAVALVLGISRALAETAALLFTSGYVSRMPTSLLDSGRSLSIHIYDLATNVAGGEPTAYASALVLMTMLLSINIATASLARRATGGARA